MTTHFYALLYQLLNKIYAWHAYSCWVCKSEQDKKASCIQGACNLLGLSKWYSSLKSANLKLTVSSTKSINKGKRVSDTRYDTLRLPEFTQ